MPKLEFENSLPSKPANSVTTIIETDKDDENKDLFVVVDNPEKHTTAMESYITFRVNTKVSVIGFVIIRVQW